MSEVGLSLLGLALAAIVLCSLLNTFKLLYRINTSRHVISFINNSFTLCAVTSGEVNKIIIKIDNYIILVIGKTLSKKIIIFE